MCQTCLYSYVLGGIYSVPGVAKIMLEHIANQKKNMIHKAAFSLESEGKNEKKPSTRLDHLRSEVR